MENTSKREITLLTYKILNAVNKCIIKNDQFTLDGFDYIDDGNFMINLDKNEYKLLKSLLE